MSTAPPDPPVSPTPGPALTPADFPHEHDPAYAISEGGDGYPGETTTHWGMCVHCRYPYPVEQNWSCGWRRAGRTRGVS